MSLNLPSRRALRSATSLNTTTTSFLIPRSTTHRTLFNFGAKGWGTGKNNIVDPTAKPSNPLTEEYLRGLSSRPKKKEKMTLTRGDLSTPSILDEEHVAGKKPKVRQPDAPGAQAVNLERNKRAMLAALDPDPTARKRWERRMVIRDIHKRGRLTRTQLLKKQERVLLSKSHDFKTSTKKLVPLARQITGKTVEEAIIQMRFSVKKAAKEVKEHLEHAKNEAIVRRGMGLGKEKDYVTRKIRTKDRKVLKVNDPTRLYIDQAWVGKGLWGKSLDSRARGKVYILKNPTTSISVVLKEEKTRIRLHEERETRLKNRKVWEQLPNRPITAQRQHYSW